MKKLIMKNWLAVALVCLAVTVQVPATVLGGHVITTDYSLFGGIHQFQENSPFAASGLLATIPGDAMGREFNGLVYVVGRGGNNIIQIFDPADSFALVKEFSIGSGRNPQDIAFIDAATAYVSCYDEAVLLKVDLENGIVTSTFSTAQFADIDGLTETSYMCYYNQKLYITSQRLDRGAWYAPVGPGALLVFDTAAEQWVDMDNGIEGVQPITLAGANPYSDLVLVQGDGSDTTLLVGCVGFYGANDGGIEQVNLSSGLSEGFLVTEADLGGDLTRFALGEAGFYTIVADAAFNTGVKFVSAADGSVSLIIQGAGFVFSDLAVMPENLLVLTDRTTGAAGLRVFDGLSLVELTTTPVSTVLPPSQFVADLSRENNTSPVIPDIAGALKVGQPFPNPCNPASVVPVMGPAGTSITVRVVDMRGRSLRSDHLTLNANGNAEFRFTGMDRLGRGLPAGQYRIVIEAEQSWVMRSLTLVK